MALQARGILFAVLMDKNTHKKERYFTELANNLKRLECKVILDEVVPTGLVCMPVYMHASITERE